MELLFVALLGALFGFIARYTLPHRSTHGALLIPAVGTITAMLVWVALTWAGLRWDGGVIWIVTLVASAAVSVLADLVVGRRRRAHDLRALEAIDA